MYVQKDPAPSDRYVQGPYLAAVRSQDFDTRRPRFVAQRFFS